MRWVISCLCLCFEVNGQALHPLRLACFSMLVPRNVSYLGLGAKDLELDPLPPLLGAH